MSTDRVVANLLLAQNSATTLRGSSAALSPVSDRKRFHELRAQAKALVIGGNTYRNEPYASAPLPLYVASRTLQESGAHLISICKDSPDSIVQRALSDHGGPIMIEGGPKFLTPLINNQQIDRIFITRVSLDGDGDFFDEDLLVRKYHLIDEKFDLAGGTTIAFQTWLPNL